MRLVLVAVVVAASIPTVGAAQQRRAPETTQHRQAREHFYGATMLYEQGNLEGAMVEFRASYAIEPLAVIHFDLAQCLRGLYRYAEAIDEYQRYLDESGPELPAERRSAVAETMAQLRRLVAPITLDIVPDGAEVRIDGRSLGEAPLLGPVVLAAGRRVLEVAADGYVPVRDELLVVARTPRTLRLRLAAVETAGTLRVRSDPPRALLRIDGLDVGVGPVERRVDAGGHIIEATLASFESFRAAVTLGQRQTFDYVAHLERAHEPPITSQWWFWGGVSVLAVAAIVLLVALWPPSRNAPVAGNVDPGIVSALRTY